jgi:hypothetical protein
MQFTKSTCAKKGGHEPFYGRRGASLLSRNIIGEEHGPGYRGGVRVVGKFGG